MPKTLADQRIRLVALTTKPADPKAPTVTELEAGVDLSCSIMKGDYQLGATGDQTVSEPTMCEPGAGNDMGATDYAGQLTVFRMLDEDGKADIDEDVAFQTLKVKGTELWLVEREGPVYDADWAADQEVSVYRVSTGSMQKPSDRFGGYIKRTFPLGVRAAHENVAVVAVVAP